MSTNRENGGYTTMYNILICDTQPDIVTRSKSIWTEGYNLFEAYTAGRRWKC